METGGGVEPSAPPHGPEEGLAMTQPRGEATRRRLLEEAVKQFGRGGYQGTSLESVAGAAGGPEKTPPPSLPSQRAPPPGGGRQTNATGAAPLSPAPPAPASRARPD